MYTVIQHDKQVQKMRVAHTKAQRVIHKAYHYTSDRAPKNEWHYEADQIFLNRPLWLQIIIDLLAVSAFINIILLVKGV